MLENVVRVLISNIIVMLTSIVNTLVIPKLLSIDGYAEYQTFMLYISYIGIMTFGFHAGLYIKYGGSNRMSIDKRQFKSEMNLILISQIIITILTVFVAYFLKNSLLFYTAICVVTCNFVSVYKYLYQAWNEFKTYSIINIIQSLGFSGLVLIIGLLQGELNASEVIVVYVTVNTLCFLGIFRSYYKENQGINSNSILSVENKRIFNIGFLIMLGSAANVVFNSVDKYFIKILFTSYEFSMYCFAITLLNVMNVFISAIAQPMYFQLAQNLEDYTARKQYKEILFCFGALSGCAYYAVTVIVKWFMPEYIGSLIVVAFLFAIFPAVAVINCLYINLYKATNQIRKYILVLITIVICSIVLNAISVLIYKSYISITLATTICYYIWLIVSSRDFKGLQIVKRDIIFLIGFFVIYFVLTNIENAILGFFTYLIAIVIWLFIIYKECVMKIGTYVFQKMKQH